MKSLFDELTDKLAADPRLTRRGGPRAETPVRAGLASASAWIAQRTIGRSRAFNAPLAEALQAFAREWYAANRPLLAARAARGLHLAAAALGAGLVASLYVRGIAFDYRDGWESTFLDAESARATLAMLYGPASWLTGIGRATATGCKAYHIAYCPQVRNRGQAWQS